MKIKIFRYLKAWIPLAVTITLMSVLIYATVQQNFRSDANDPQLQIAEDISAGLSAGRTLNQFAQQVDISKSLDSYVIAYDNKKEPVAYSGVLNSKVPVPPNGVFEYAEKNGEDRLTWEPQPGVRSAIVVRHYSSIEGNAGFVLVGRSLRETDKRVEVLTQHILIGWTTSLFITLLSIIASDILFNWLSKPNAFSEEPAKEKSV